KFRVIHGEIATADFIGFAMTGERVRNDIKRKHLFHDGIIINNFFQFVKYFFHFGNFFSLR
ncbi:MAG: hypothetical protein CVU93_00650, partial [Firmicutes bacterium HGW-Firmicutes-18]